MGTVVPMPQTLVIRHFLEFYLLLIIATLFYSVRRLNITIVASCDSLIVILVP